MGGGLSAPGEREAQGQEDGKESAPLNPEAPEFTIHHLPRATPGSAGLDLAALTDIIISSWDGVHLISTSVSGTLPPGTVDYKKNLKL